MQKGKIQVNEIGDKLTALCVKSESVNTYIRKDILKTFKLKRRQNLTIMGKIGNFEIQKMEIDEKLKKNMAKIENNTNEWGYCI